MTVRADPFANQPDFWVDAVLDGAGNLVSQTGHDALFARTSPGVFTVTLTPNGAAADSHICKVEYDAAAGLFVRVADTTDKIKTITMNDSGNNLSDIATKIRYVGWFAK